MVTMKLTVKSGCGVVFEYVYSHIDQEFVRIKILADAVFEILKF